MLRDYPISANLMMRHQPMNTLDFTLPSDLEATAPPEARGLSRDDVRLMVSYTADDSIVDTHFHSLPDFLDAGDVVAINTSGTMNAALPAMRADGTQLELHLSTQLPAGQWIVELRLPAETATQPFFDGIAGERLQLPEGGFVELHTPHNPAERFNLSAKTRLWIASLSHPCSLQDYLMQHGFPIRYNYVPDSWSPEYYQTVYVTEMGSAEMPSAGRAFTPQLITRLVAKGVQIVPLILHTGVASQEAHETPYEEYYRVSAETARHINHAHQHQKRVIAVGTTVIRALETVTSEDGIVHPGEGWTKLIITPDATIRAVNGLLTGFHEPQASHLAMLEAFAGRQHLQATYTQALSERYLWHEFGDLHLMLREL